MSPVRPSWTLPLLLLAPAQAAEPPPAAPWSGVISVDEIIRGPTAQGGDQRELDHDAQVITDRIKQAHSQILTAPPFIARVVREDMGFYQAELERVAAERGGPLPIGHTTYFIKGGRMLVVSDGDRILVDRSKNLAEGVVDGLPFSAKLQAEPDVESLDGAIAVEPIAGYPTRRASIKIKGHSFTIDIALGLPNPYRLGLMERDQDDDLVRALAAYQGLPMLVAETSTEVSRSLSVISVDRRDINDRIFRP